MKKMKYDVMGDVEWVTNQLDKAFNSGLMTEKSWKVAERIVKSLYTKNLNGWVVPCSDGFFRAESNKPPKKLLKFAKRCKVIF